MRDLMAPHGNRLVALTLLSQFPVNYTGCRHNICLAQSKCAKRRMRAANNSEQFSVRKFRAVYIRDSWRAFLAVT